MERIKYYDTLRFLAIFGVIILHVFQSFPASTTLINFKVISLSEIFEYAVPVFLMISGALLLGRDIQLTDFLKRRFTRLTFPFILYMIIYAVVLFLLMSYVTGFGMLEKWLLRLPLNYNWYFWTILTLYLAIPVINKFILHSSFKEIEYFLYVLVFASILYQIILVLKLRPYINLNLFVSPIAYLILGYWLSHKDFSNRIYKIAILFFIGATLLKMAGSLGYLPLPLTENYEATRSMIVASYIDMGFLQIVQASALFLIIRYIYSTDNILSSFLTGNKVNAFILSISQASYGMYLFHHTLIEPLRCILRNYKFTGLETLILVCVLTVIVFIACWMVVLAISKIPFISRYSGYH
ncbi:acyltransferase [Methanobrevibacter sp.]|uniref:acyltransferase n=1 Tax=Methanobrevibacter sp. TaxID=66852 RepID=UPI00388E2ECA